MIRKKTNMIKEQKKKPMHPPDLHWSYEPSWQFYFSLSPPATDLHYGKFVNFARGNY